MSQHSKLELDRDAVEDCHYLAESVVAAVVAEIEGSSTVSIERALLRLLGIAGANSEGVPHVNCIVDNLKHAGGLPDGICYWLFRTALAEGIPLAEAAERLCCDSDYILGVPSVEMEQIEDLCRHTFSEAIDSIATRHAHRAALREAAERKPLPLRYVLIGTGSVTEDVVHARAAAEAGGDIVAVIRSTAQSLLDYVPFGETEEGYGGTFATQENFQAMRRAMDAWSMEHRRYIRLSSFCSGLCMPEIAVMGAIEGYDNMVNDALYGVLYRDINPVRTIIDQFVSRRLNGVFGVTINTGEDNYLRTADAVEAASSVVASQFVNYHMARACDLPDDLIGIGNAFEIAPETENGLLLEWAQALLTRELFPNCPTKFMPPTKHMNGDLLRTHACDILFNLVAVATNQGIQTVGVPTEGVFTPLIHDRAQGLQGADFAATFARNLHAEIEFRPDGIVHRRAAEVLQAARTILRRIQTRGLFGSLEDGVFGDVARTKEGGKGPDGVFACSPRYINGFYLAACAKTARSNAA